VRLRMAPAVSRLDQRGLVTMLTYEEYIVLGHLIMVCPFVASHSRRN